MKTRKIVFYLMALVVTLLMPSCTKEKEFTGAEAGKSVTRMSFTIVTPSSSSIISTKSMSETEVKETQVEELAFFFFQKENTTRAADMVLSSVEDFTLGNPAEKIVDGQPTYVYSVDFENDDPALVSGEWYVYAIANWDKNFFRVSLEDLKTMKRSEIDDYCVLKNSVGVIPTDTALLLTGRAGDDNSGLVTIDPGAADLGSIHLRRLVSKVTINISGNTANGVTFTPKRLFIYNYSRSCTLFERSGWANASGSVDYAYGTSPATLEYKGIGVDDAFSDPSNAGLGYDIQSGSYTFYMCENVQKAKNAVSSYHDRERHVSDTDMSFLNAPDHGTYVVVTGDYEGPDVTLDPENGSVSADSGSANRIEGSVSYTIHLGNFSTASGKTQGSNDNFTVRRNAKYIYNVTVNGVNNIIVEAEYKTENQPGAEGDLLTTKSGTTKVELDSHYGQVLIQIPDEAHFDSYSFVLDTPFTGGKKVVSGYEDGLDVNWIKFARPASSDRIKTYGEAITSGLGDIYALLSDLKAETGLYYLVEGGHKYVAAYVDENFYEDKPLSAFVNAKPRELSLSTSVSWSPDGHSSFTQTPIFSIKQKSITSPFLYTAANPFGVEELEETELTDTFMSGSSNNSLTFGWQNMTKPFQTDDAQDWSSYVDETVNVYVNNEIAGSPMNNTEGMYQCLSRNRDLDGDGKISKDEIRWYLPAAEQCNVLWYGSSLINNAIKQAKTYWSSTTQSRTWWALEGVAFNAKNEAGTSVRCIRTLKQYDAGTSPVYETVGDLGSGLVVNVLNLNSNDQAVVRNVTAADHQSGEYDTHHSNDGVNDKLPSSFRIAKDILRIPDTDAEEAVLFEASYDGEAKSETVDFGISDIIKISVDVSNELSTVTDANILSIGGAIDSWAGQNVHFYYTPSKRGLKIEVMKTGGLDKRYAVQIPADQQSIDVIYTSKYVVVDGAVYPHEAYTAANLQIGSLEGNNRSHSSIAASAGRNAIGVETFSEDDIKNGNICQANYSEADDPGKGVWRVPNEKEFAMMVSAHNSNTNMPILLNGSAARTSFTRDPSVYKTPGESFFFFYGGVVSTDMNSRPKTFYVRCVRDNY